MPRMKLCEDHHNWLIVELYQRGLTRWVPDNSDEAHERYLKTREQGITKETFEPVFFAAFAIMVNAAKFGGVNTSEEDNGCPICAEPDERQSWLGFAADDAHKEALRLGFTAEEMAKVDW